MCLLTTAAYVLYQSDRQAGQATQVTAESLGKQLEFQLLRINAGFGRAHQFPDFELWKQTGSLPGICVRFVLTDRAAQHSLCNGAKRAGLIPPEVFVTVYRLHGAVRLY